MIDADYMNNLAFLQNMPVQAQFLLHSLEQAAGGTGHYVNKMLMRVKQKGDISHPSGGLLKLVDQFTYLNSNISSTESNVNICLSKAWNAIDRLSIIWKFAQSDKIKRDFFQAVTVSILLYGCTTWTLTKHIEKKLDGNNTRMVHAILNKSLKQHPIKQLYGHLPPITQTIKVRWTKHVRNCWKSKDELISNVFQMHHNI